MKTNQKETRSLGEFVKAKLGTSLVHYSLCENVPLRTLHDRWLTEDGKTRMMHSIFCKFANENGNDHVKIFIEQYNKI